MNESLPEDKKSQSRLPLVFGILNGIMAACCGFIWFLFVFAAVRKPEKLFNPEFLVWAGFLGGLYGIAMLVYCAAAAAMVTKRHRGKKHWGYYCHWLGILFSPLLCACTGTLYFPVALYYSLQPEFAEAFSDPDPPA